MNFVAKQYLLIISLMLAWVHVQAQGYNFVGNSFPVGNDCFVLTQAQTWQNGAIWYSEAINITEPFNLQFTATFGSNDAGADGMVFVMQQVGNQVIGVSGGGMGFEGFAPSLGVEFDTFQNLDFNDPPFDHVAISKNGNAVHGNPNSIAAPVPISSTSNNVEDGQPYVIDISWNPSNNLFSVSVNCVLRLAATINLTTTVFQLGTNVFWGFTGATGGQFNEQRICLDPLILGLPPVYNACQNVPLQLDAPAASFGSVSWEPAAFLDDPTSFSPVATVDETTTFTLTYEDLCGNLQVQQTTLIVFEPSVDLGVNVDLCTNEPVLLSAGGEYDEITWFDGTDQSTVAVSASGQYWVEVSQGTCLAFDTILVDINPLPEYTGTLLAQLCEGEEFTFELGTSDSEIVWFDGANDEVRMFNESGNYSFELIDEPCSSDFTLEVNVTPTPNFSLGPDIAVCDDGAFLLTASGAYDSVTWFDGSNNASVSLTASGSYWADFTQGFCQATDTVAIAFDSPPIYAGPSAIALCEGEEFVFDLGGINAEIMWFDGSNAGIRTFDDTGDYAFQLLNGECISDFELAIEVTPIPVFTLGDDLTICPGIPHVLSPSLAGINYTWNDGGIAPSFEVSQGGLYWATANSNNCLYSDTVLVGTHPVPTLVIGGSESLCPEEQGFLVAETTAALVWSTGESTPSITITRPGIYSATATNSDGCIAVKSFRVGALTLPRISLVEDLLKCIGKDVMVLVESSDNFNLIWSDGTLGNSIQITTAGSYLVSLTNECGITRREFDVVEEECFNAYFLPNAFTPNGDGLNDLFKGEIERFEDFELLIFNRFGDLVFETNDPNYGWNGSFLNNGYYCEAGIYSVRFSIDFGNNEIIQEFGSVTLVR